MPITWRNIEAPDFRGAQAGIESASRMIGGALGSLGQLANQQRQLNIAEAQGLQQMAAEDQQRTKDIDTQAALDQIASITNMDVYKDTDLRDIIGKNINANRKEVRDAFLAQERRIRDRQELTPDQRLEWDLARDVINSEMGSQMDLLNQQKISLGQQFPTDDTLTPATEVRSLADSIQYINKNVDDALFDFTWNDKGLSREKAVSRFKELTDVAHKEFVKNLPPEKRQFYSQPNAQAAQLALESMFMAGDNEINLDQYVPTYLNYVSRLMQNDVNRRKKEAGEQLLLQKSATLRRNAQQQQLDYIKKIKGQ